MTTTDIETLLAQTTLRVVLGGLLFVVRLERSARGSELWILKLLLFLDRVGKRVDGDDVGTRLL